MIRQPLRAPLTVCLWLTDYCNLDCAYCYAKPFSGRRMDPTRVMSLVDELIDMQVFDLTLAGGEPSLHPRVLDIVGRTVKAGMRVGMLSNGVALSDRLIAELARCTTARDFILQISIDSIDPAINDPVRGKTARVVRTIDKLCETDIDLQLATVVHSGNVDTAHLVIERYYPRIKRFHFLNVQRTSSALEHPEILLDEGRALEFWLRLADYAAQFPPDLFLPSLRIQLRAMGSARVDPEASLHREASFDCGVCSAGWTHINVTSDFDVLGCDIAREHSFMGNCATDSFETVWRSERADAVRNQPFPGCYKIAGPDGTRLSDQLKPDYVPFA
ncbi:radical SAM/SPASM domain-containing protein [Salinarimonas sp. NSM]|uniref:radical SAM/SPASM domain-containing protein n=1 Tax=Salinarimonas sp. NSM TaxID=3458003 RepID=UPI004036B899